MKLANYIFIIFLLIISSNYLIAITESKRLRHYNSLKNFATHQSIVMLEIEMMEKNKISSSGGSRSGLNINSNFYNNQKVN